MNTHTPGPWAVHANVRDSRTDAARIDAGDTLVATVSTLPTKTTAAWHEAHANARLLAAAPDMLEALQSLVRAVEQFTSAVALGWPELEQAKAAIAKATGEQA